MGALGLALALLGGLLACCAIVKAEEECLYSRISCYECNSWTDKRCLDPFNVTAHPNDLPALEECEGCCVKIVTDHGTPQEAIRRTCTTKIQINLFLVDHVCMLESDGRGHMCFCESNGCNAAPRIPGSSPALQTVGMLFASAATALLSAFISPLNSWPPLQHHHPHH